MFKWYLVPSAVGDSQDFAAWLLCGNPRDNSNCIFTVQLYAIHLEFGMPVALYNSRSTQFWSCRFGIEPLMTRSRPD